MKDVLIIGAGGHGQVVADVLLCMQAAGAGVHPAGFVDDDSRRQGARVLGLPVLGLIAELPSIPHDGIIIAIGSNRDRQRLYVELQERGEKFIVARHPQAIIAADVYLGPGCAVMAGVVINTGSIIGENCILNTSCSMDHHGRVGAHSHIAPGAHLGGEVMVGEGVLVGIGASVLPGKAIGSWAVVGAGSVLIGDVPAGATVVGNPARVVKEGRP